MKRNNLSSPWMEPVREPRPFTFRWCWDDVTSIKSSDTTNPCDYDSDSVRYTMAMVLTPKEPAYVPTQIFVNNGVTVCKFADGDVI